MDIDVPHLFGPRIVKTVNSKSIGACIVRDAPFISHDSIESRNPTALGKSRQAVSLP